MSRLLAILVVLSLALAGACVAPGGPDPETEANKAAVRAYLDRLVNRGELEAWPELIADDTLTFNGEPMSRDDMRRMRDTFRQILPDYHVTVEEQTAAGDVVASRVTITGTHRGDYMGLKASGKQLSIDGITYDRFRDGKLVEAWHQMDLWGTLLMASDD